MREKWMRDCVDTAFINTMGTRPELYYSSVLVRMCEHSLRQVQVRVCVCVCE